MDELDNKGVAEPTTPDVSSGLEPGQRTDDVLPTPGNNETSPYTDEELKEVIEQDGEIDRKRLTPAQEALRKTFERGYTPKFQEAARLKKEAEDMIAEAQKKPETFYEDEQTNKLFTTFVDNPNKVATDITREINRLEDIMDSYDKDTPEYYQAKTAKRQWQSIFNDFTVKRQDVLDSRRVNEISRIQLGDEYEKLEAYAKTLGFSVNDFRTKPELRKSVKTLYDAANAVQTAQKKEVKLTPPKLATQSSGGASPQSKKDPYDPNAEMSTEERIALWRAQRK